MSHFDMWTLNIIQVADWINKKTRHATLEARQPKSANTIRDIHSYNLSSILGRLGRSIFNLLCTKFGLRNTRLLDIVTEQLFVLAESCDHPGVRVPNWLDLEKGIHALQRDTLGLGNEEIDKYDGADHQGGKKEEHAVFHLGEHLRGEARDEEVPKPVRSSGASLCQRTHVGVEHFLKAVSLTPLTWG